MFLTAVKQAIYTEPCFLCLSRMCVCVRVCVFASVFFLPHNIKLTECQHSEQISETFHPLRAQLKLCGFNEHFYNNTGFTKTSEDMFFSLRQ